MFKRQSVILLIGLRIGFGASVCHAESLKVLEVLEKYGEGRSAEAYLELGRLGDPSAVPRLERSVQRDQEWRKEYPDTIPHYPGPAFQALARMRVRNYYKQVIDYCAVTINPQNSADGMTQIEAWRVLVYVGGKQAIQLADKYLDGWESVSIYEVPTGLAAAKVLGAWIREGPVKDPVTLEDYQSWCAWWAQNKHRYADWDPKPNSSDSAQPAASPKPEPAARTSGNPTVGPTSPHVDEANSDSSELSRHRWVFGVTVTVLIAGIAFSVALFKKSRGSTR